MNYKNWLFLASLIAFTAFSMQQPAAQQPGPQLPEAEIKAFFAAIEKEDTQEVIALLHKIPALANSYLKNIAALRKAAFTGNAEIVTALLGANADPNPSDPAGLTPLMMAVARGYLEIVKLLIASGARINAVNRLGLSVMDYNGQFGIGSQNNKNQIRRILSEQEKLAR